ncbi:MurR/RpiR family transcriptional regulator [Photobacterium sp. BZF1]|uniref:MurR/RpiR family transcriptional regulator n=1 Tax=Photobacterium rosenbergii TaxID=294936 RepID=A0A2T3NL38_9GAMM|nr:MULTISPECIES: MurR/RpiR family transcriptional regulator [Photobacterium]MBC7003578.1 MurR/RpiR family transcriptional regulator [Photobacterium sp. BZF1]MBY5947777.1 MurR/RpiR family transcriptional regulator [Photobacterium rosenbergii]PSW16227.1 MurR/RpiR family transcriptional regulator [Photobacterium rosenbergii]
MDVEEQVPADLDTLRELIVKRYDSLSGRLQQVADFVMAQPMLVAVETMATIAEQANVPLSTLSRFSNAMGYSGFSSMQSLFRDQYLNRPRDYIERVRKARETDEVSQDSPMAIFQDFGQANIEAMEQLQMSVSPQKLERAVSLLDEAETIYIQGMRRAYPVAFYLWYALMKSDNNVVLLDDHGGMLSPMTRRMNEKDVLVTVTYSPYAPETSSLIDAAFEKKVPIVAITDNQMTSQGSKMEVCFEVLEGEIMGFRSLSSSLYLAQTLAVSLMCQEVKQEP